MTGPVAMTPSAAQLLITQSIRRLAPKVEAKGATAMDCPVSGGCHRAATGNISIFAGGERAAFERVLPILSILGHQILHTGPIGSASMLKVMTNYLCTVHLVALAEAPGRASDVLALTRLLLKELPGTAPHTDTTAAGRSLHRLRPALDLVAGADFRLVTIEEAAARCHLSPSYFSRAFARAFGVGFAEYARAYRLRAAARSLTTEGARVSDIAWRSGFQTPSHFTAAFRKRFGVSPSDFRRRYLAGR
jgi:AraC-like DNA-binding protein